jgi:hypothetical protein
MIKFESEKHLEDFICESLDDGVCVVDNIDFDTYKRQYKCGSYGVADIVAFNCVEINGKPEVLEIYIYELKNEKFSVKHLSQVSRYYTYFKRMAEDIYPDLTISIYPSVVCLDDDLSDDDYISNIDDFSIPIYKYSVCPKSGFRITQSQGIRLKTESIAECDHVNELMGV